MFAFLRFRCPMFVRRVHLWWWFRGTPAPSVHLTPEAELENVHRAHFTPLEVGPWGVLAFTRVHDRVMVGIWKNLRLTSGLMLTESQFQRMLAAFGSDEQRQQTVPREEPAVFRKIRLA